MFETGPKKNPPFYVEEDKTRVALQLPEKQEQIVWVNWEEDQRSFYDQFLKEKRSALGAESPSRRNFLSEDGDLRADFAAPADLLPSSVWSPENIPEKAQISRRSAMIWKR